MLKDLDGESLRSKISACWLGKAVGGTLGQTFEGLEGPLDADFYRPVPTEMIPNDDLDLQVLYACLMDEMAEPRVDRGLIADAWRSHVAFPWNEYGVGMRNLAEGLLPPDTGSFDNWFTCGEGAAIRTELWACLAAGDPDLAAAYAFEDACFDHAGDGVYAAQFLARMQAAAFVNCNIDELIDIGLAGIPADSGIANVVRKTLAWVDQEKTWQAVRERIMVEFGCSDMTNVLPNTGFIILGLKMGNDFSSRICITNNCGEDTDSSTASIGSILGIIDPDCIDAKWLSPIGNQLVLNKEITGITPPATLDGFTDLVISLRRRIAGRAPEVIPTQAPVKHPISVESAWTNGSNYRWDKRDMSELPPVGARAPIEDLNFKRTELPGTWTKIPLSECEDRILYVKYEMNPQGREDVRLMINTNAEFRCWLNGNFHFASMGSTGLNPAPHSPQTGQSIDFHLEQQTHELLVAFRKPKPSHEFLEWIIALVELPSAMWIENAFRPKPENQLDKRNG